LLADLPGEIRRIAGFLDIPITDSVIAALAPDVSLATLRRVAESHGSFTSLKGGPQTFFFKGSNGRWKDLLSAEELALYGQTAANVLPPDCRAWLEHGRSAYQA
jgi:aryl sulfotransferase